MPGKLQFVSTPIGNLGDLSRRAVDALRNADLVACEDTRHSGRLLAQIDAKSTLVSLHEHNEKERIPRLLEALTRGETVAVVSDAGTPLVSDPGFALSRAAVAAGATLEAIPGPSALLVALVVSGLEPLPFTFLGFPPPKTGKRKRFFETYSDLDHTLIVYESPHRIVRSLADAREVLGNRRVAVARELTKLHEEVLRGRLQDVEESLAARAKVKGELVVVVGRPDEG